METSLIDTVLTIISAHTAQAWATFNRSAAAHAHAARARWRAPLGERKGRTRHRRVTTVSSTDIYIFLAPRSARRSDASNAAGWSAMVSRRKPMAPKGAWQEVALARSNACGARATGLASAPRSALRRPPGRLRRSRAVGGRKPTAPLADCSLWRSRVQTPEAHAQPGWHQRLAARCARRSDASDAAGQSAGESLRHHRPPARLRRPRVRTQPGSSRQRKSLRRTHARARAAALVRSCVGATRRRSRAIPPAAPTLGRGRPNSPFGVRARRRGWASALRAGERASPIPPLDQNVRARAPPRVLPASHLTGGRRMAAKAPRGAM
jgi:hypothetical protein